MIVLKRLLTQTIELNVSCRNVMSRQDLQKVIKDAIIKYKKIIFGVDNPICIECLSELLKLQVIDKIVYRKKLLEDTLMKLTWDNIVVGSE